MYNRIMMTYVVRDGAVEVIPNGESVWSVVKR